MTIQEMIQAAQMLSVEERKQLIKALVDIVDAPVTEAPKKRSTTELEAIAERLADEEDPQDYPKHLRTE